MKTKALMVFALLLLRWSTVAAGLSVKFYVSLVPYVYMYMQPEQYSLQEMRGKYWITLRICSLNATLSDTYTCNATIDPATGVKNVLGDMDGYSTQSITVGELEDELSCN
jgi:hypothetical protein